MNSSSFTVAERIASLKAAVVGGFSAGLVSFILLLVHRVLTLDTEFNLSSVLMDLVNLTVLLKGAIAGLSGALFALTYRYAIRTDHNPQLNVGVVLAFTLVRGFAQMDVEAAIAQNFVPLVLSCGDSFLIFGLTALTLTFAIQRGWLSLFES